VELENITKSVKKIALLNDKLAKQASLSATTKRRRKSSRSPANNILKMGILRLFSVPVKNLASFLAQESCSYEPVRGGLNGSGGSMKVVDQFLFSWAMGYRCAATKIE
jgi:hypothetical protein